MPAAGELSSTEYVPTVTAGILSLCWWRAKDDLDTGPGGLPSKGLENVFGTVSNCDFPSSDTTIAALVKESSSSHSTCSSEKAIAVAYAWTCPICCSMWQDIAYATPCNRMFYLGCIQWWLRLRASCLLCRIAMNTIKVSVQGGDFHHIRYLATSITAVPPPPVALQRVLCPLCH